MHQNKAWTAAAVLAAMATVCGCRRAGSPAFVDGKGNPAIFLISQAVAHGGKPARGVITPNFNWAWRYATDSTGVILQFRIEHFVEVTNLLGQAFGAPAQGSMPSGAGSAVGWYDAGKTGVGIQFGYQGELGQVILTRSTAGDR
jgi:hypothetical protein